MYLSVKNHFILFRCLDRKDLSRYKVKFRTVKYRELSRNKGGKDILRKAYSRDIVLISSNSIFHNLNVSKVSISFSSLPRKIF